MIINSYLQLNLSKKSQNICYIYTGGWNQTDNSTLTIHPEHQRRRRPLNAAFGDRVGHHACVVAHIQRYHLGDVEVACLLRHKAPRVLGDKRRVLVEDPREGEFCPNT